MTSRYCVMDVTSAIYKEEGCYLQRNNGGYTERCYCYNDKCNGAGHTAVSLTTVLTCIIIFISAIYWKWNIKLRYSSCFHWLCWGRDIMSQTSYNPLVSGKMFYARFWNGKLPKMCVRVCVFAVKRKPVTFKVKHGT